MAFNAESFIPATSALTFVHEAVGLQFALGAVLAIVVLASDFDVGPAVTTALCAIAAYIVGSDAVIRLARSFNK